MMAYDIQTLSASQFKDLQTRLNYHFQDLNLLQCALTHRSLKQEQPCYEQLEFLGDRVVGLIIADRLYHSLPDAEEGELSKRLSALVNGKFLAELMGALKIDEFILMTPEARESGIHKNPTILADVAESILAAIYLDGGMVAAQKFITKIIGEDLEHYPMALDSKSKLQAWCQARGLDLPIYQETSRTGSDHLPCFYFQVNVRQENSSVKSAEGQGKNKREAMQEAAKNYYHQYIDKSS